MMSVDFYMRINTAFLKDLERDFEDNDLTDEEYLEELKLIAIDEGIADIKSAGFANAYWDTGRNVFSWLPNQVYGGVKQK